MRKEARNDRKRIEKTTVVMKPEGRKVVTFPAKKDVHPKKGWINWWENITDLISRHTRKQKLKKEIEEICITLK